MTRVEDELLFSTPTATAAEAHLLGQNSPQTSETTRPTQ